MNDGIGSPGWARRPRVFDHPELGHYESWFVRANAPGSARAFWIRYTLFVPERDPHARLTELWAIYFDADNNELIAAQEDIPWSRSRIAADTLDLDFRGSVFQPGLLQGEVRGKVHRLAWDLAYEQGQTPLLLLPENRYSGGFPKAKSLVTQPMARFSGTLTLDGEPVQIDDWVGSENHNWGSRHTDAYAWGQVCGFDNAPEAFLECASARLRMGPLWTPHLSLAVLRLGDRTLYFNQLSRAIRNQGTYDFQTWDLLCNNGQERLSIRIEAVPGQTAALHYKNPPGGIKTCLNTKLAACSVHLERPDHPPLELQSTSGAAFEILTDKPPLGTEYAN